jgi:hypothetical protein
MQIAPEYEVRILRDVGTAALGAYRMVTVAQAKARNAIGLPPGKHQDLMPDAWFNAWTKAAFAADPWRANRRSFAVPLSLFFA